MNDATEQAAGSAQPQAITSETITFKRRHFYIVVALLIFVCGMASGYLLWGPRPDYVPEEAPSAVGESDAAEAEAVPQLAPETMQRVSVSADNDPYFGPQNAPVTIIEFSDFE